MPLLATFPRYTCVCQRACSGVPTTPTTTFMHSTFSSLKLRTTMDEQPNFFIFRSPRLYHLCELTPTLRTSTINSTAHPTHLPAVRLMYRHLIVLPHTLFASLLHSCLRMTFNNSNSPAVDTSPRRCSEHEADRLRKPRLVIRKARALGHLERPSS